MTLISEKKLFTPGPLNCSRNVKESMMIDLGSRDKQFIDCIKDIRRDLLKISAVNKVRCFSFLKV